jgi:diacylglycerol kinase (ATP)
LANSGKRGLARLVAALRYSYLGFRAAWSGEEAFRQEVLLTLALLPLALWLGESPLQRALLLAVCLLVLIVELLNSAVEAAVDRVGLQHDPIAARAKDMGSAAVLLALVMAALVWAGVILQRFASG